jgi:hypothetical protein
MDREVLNYFEAILQQDVLALEQAINPADEIPDQDYRRALNVKLEAIKADVANIQHLLDT